VPLPDISFFVWYEYITHNSILWIWMKAGLAGFLALLFLIGWTVSSGARTVFKLRDEGERVLALTAVLYVVMHFVFAYVDMAWDSQSMVCLGAMMGLLSRLEGSLVPVGKPPARRWLWPAAARPTSAPGA
jgi:O-antigen ligase